MPILKWNPIKNQSLIRHRGVSFENVAYAIENNLIADIIPHHNQARYPGQLILYFQKAGYMYACPFVKQTDGSWFLKTIYPSRKAVKQYIKGN